MRYNPLGIIPAAVLMTAMAVTSIAQTEVPLASRADVTSIQKAVEQLVVAINNRDEKAVHALTIPSFDARGEGIWLNRSGAPQFGRSTNRYEGVEVAALVRGARLITSDVALAEGFFRTIKWPGGTDAAGALAVTLVNVTEDGSWRQRASAPIVSAIGPPLW